MANRIITELGKYEEEVSEEETDALSLDRMIRDHKKVSAEKNRQIKKFNNKLAMQSVEFSSPKG